MTSTALTCRQWSSSIIDRNMKINQSGAHMTGLYWDLGLLLLRLKQICGKHGQWETKLDKMGIGRTRATKAMKINETFEVRADCEQMPVAKAYAMRKRKKTVEYENPQLPDNSCFCPNERIRIYNCRFQDLEGLGGVKPETVDLLKTDPRTSATGCRRCPIWLPLPNDRSSPAGWPCSTTATTT